MIISFGFEIALRLERETAVLFSLKVHPSHLKDLISGEDFVRSLHVPSTITWTPTATGADACVSDRESFDS